MDIFAFEMNGDYFGIPIENLAYIEGRWENVEGEIGTPDYIEKIVFVNGALLPIYDLASKLGYDGQKGGHEYVVSVNVKDMKFGFSLRGASEVITVDECGVYPVPAEIDAERSCLKNMVCHNGRVIGLIDVGRLIPKGKNEF